MVVKTYLFFFIKDDEVWEKYNKTWDMIKDKLGSKSSASLFRRV